MSLGRIKPKYASLNFTNESNDSSDTQKAIIEENFGFEIIDKANSYVCAVERMELSLNAIPFYKGLKVEHNGGVGGQETFYCWNAATDDNSFGFDDESPIGVGNIPANYDITLVNMFTVDEMAADQLNFFSLKEVLKHLNNIDFPIIDTNGAIVVGETYNCVFEIDELGYIKCTAGLTSDGNQPVFKAAANDDMFQRIKFPKYLNMILGLGSKVVDNGADDTLISDFPRFDLGDELAHILLTTSLPVISDCIGQELNQVLTDFSPTSVYSSSYAFNAGALVASSVTLNTRQKLIYVPAEKRYLDLTSPFNIRHINIQAFYMTNFNKLYPVELPLGGTFQVKLGFYMK